MQKKLLALLLTVVVAITTITAPANLAQAATNTAKVDQVIEALGIMDTDKGNSDDQTVTVTRAQFSQMLINMSTYKDTVSAASNVSLFSDVTKKHWAAGYIQVAINQGWMSGYLNGTFKPNKGVTLLQAVNAVLKILGYTSSDYTGSVSSGQMALYVTKDLNTNITKTKNQYLTRKDVMNLIYNTLTATTKSGEIYGKTLGYTIDSDGEIDYLSLLSSEMEGPVIADNNWNTEIPFSLLSATYYKNGSVSKFSAIEDYDVIYYSESLNTIWAYDSKVTGIVKDIAPNRLNPTTVTIGSKDYTLGTSEMSIEFSTLGKTDEGDIVTLLLGKDGTVVGILSLDEYNTTITGVVLETGEHISLSSTETELKYSDYIVLVDSQGNEYEQDCADEMYFSEGDIARVTYENGVATVSKFNMGSTNFGNNTFSSDSTALGQYNLATNVKILDIYNGQYMSVYPERLANVTLGSSTVNYCEKNEVGEITQLILNNVTGDLFDYGILTGITYQQTNLLTYAYLIDGTAGSSTTARVADYGVEKGPKGFMFENNTLIATLNLTGVSVANIGTTTIQTATTKYPLADELAVYYLENSEYNLTTIKKVSDLTKYKLTAYYDRTVSSGGQVRVIVAENIE